MALAAAASRLGTPLGIAGTVRVTAAASLAPTLLEALASRLDRYPALRVELALDDHVADLGGGRWDLAVRIAPRIADAGLLARRLAPLPLLALASPGYLAKHGTPKTPDDLAQHRLIGLRLPATGRVMPRLFRVSGGTRRFVPDFTLIVNGSDALRTATRLGSGIAQVGAEGTAPLLSGNQLATVLDPFRPVPWAFWMLRASGPAGPALTAVIEAFVAAFRPKTTHTSSSATSPS